jgi:nucleotide-binding universal stress UspA family protein
MNTVAPAKRISLKDILYATDFSPAAIAALPYVRGIAQRYGSKIHVLHVKQPTSYAFVTPDMIPNVMAMEEQIEKERTEEIHKVFKGIPHDVVFESRSLSVVFEELFAGNSIDLVVIGTRGRTGLTKVLLGSVAAEILRRAPCPVLTVGPHCTGSAKDHLKMKEILYATDFSPEAVAAASYAISLAQENEAELVLLNVVKQTDAADFVHPEQYIDSTYRLLQNLIPPKAELWCTPRCIVTDGVPADAILKIAGERNPDLIVLGVKDVDRIMAVATHLARATAQQIIANACCPVLTVRVPTSH